MTHIVLLFLVEREDADFFNICAEEALKDSVSGTSSAATNEKGVVFENGHNNLIVIIFAQRYKPIKCNNSTDS